MSDPFTKDEGKALWRQAMALAQPAPAMPSVSALDLAAWLDGRADQALVARVESALVADPVLLDMALAVPDAALDADAAASERVFVRARTLVAPRVKPAARSGGWLGGFARWRRTAEWAMVGVSLMVAVATGLWIGGDFGDSLAAQTASLSLFGDDGGSYSGLLSSNEDL